MCGRFSNIAVDGGVLQEVERDILAQAAEWSVGTNGLSAVDARPGTPVTTVTRTDGVLAATSFMWGLPAPWDAGKLLFNTRVEKAVGASGMWPPIAGQFRCLVPAARFWERSREGGSVSFLGDDGCARTPLVMMAGVYYEGRMSVVTTEPSPEVARFHDRMPLCLTPLQAGLWLSPAWRDAAFAGPAPCIVAERPSGPVQLTLF